MSKFRPLFNDLLNYAMQHTWSHWEIFLFEASHKYLSIASKDFLSAQPSASTADKKYLNGFFLYFSAAGAEEHQDDCSGRRSNDWTCSLDNWRREMLIFSLVFLRRPIRSMRPEGKNGRMCTRSSWTETRTMERYLSQALRLARLSRSFMTSNLGWTSNLTDLEFFVAFFPES